MYIKKSIINWVFGILLAGAAWAAGFYSSGVLNDLNNPNLAAQGEGGVSEVVATVNGEVVTDLELQSGLASGFDRAVVVDRYVNKVISAQLGEKTYPELARDAKRAAYREVLSTLYTSRQMQTIREAISDEQIQTYYDDNILPENFKEWRVQYYLSNDREDVVKTREKMLKGDKEALGQLELLILNLKMGLLVFKQYRMG